MSTFNWNTRAPSIFYSPAGHRAAQAESKAGMAMDSKGRALVQMAPRSKGAITIASPEDSRKTQRIKRGTSI